MNFKQGPDGQLTVELSEKETNDLLDSLGDYQEQVALVHHTMILRLLAGLAYARKNSWTPEEVRMLAGAQKKNSCTPEEVATQIEALASEMEADPHDSRYLFRRLLDAEVEALRDMAESIHQGCFEDARRSGLTLAATTLARLPQSCKDLLGPFD